MIGIDVGGTFTDVVAVEGGEIRAVKVPTHVRDTEQGVLEGAKAVDVASAAVFNHASTVGLNAVLTRRLPKIGFLTTLGHRDILDVGRTWRPLEALTDPSWRRPFGDAASPLVPRYLRRGVRERITAAGETLIELDEEQAVEQLEVMKRCDVVGVAICLLNAYIEPRHEVRLRELVAEVLGDEVACSISSDVSPLAKEYARASTTVVDVFMKLIYGGYSERLSAGLRELGFEGQLNFADCAAMLVSSDFAMEHPFRIVFSGPAAGTVSSAHLGEMVGDANLLCADVGGTSCDISVVTDGKPFVGTTFELEHDLIVNALSNEISSIGAGGGSIVKVTAAGELQVGPESAGAEPGPACYGKGGTEPTLSDACLLIGLLDAERFAGGQMKLDTALAEQAFERLDSPLSLGQRVSYAYNMGLNNVAEGIIDIAVKHGVDPRDYSLMAYGAAGPMLLPGLIDLVRVRRVIVPPYPGLFSALGLLSSDLVYADSRSNYVVLSGDVAATIDSIYSGMEEELLARMGAERDDVELARSFDARLLGQTWETPFIDAPGGRIDGAAIGQMINAFHDVYEQRNGNRFDAIPVQGVTYRVQVIVPVDKVRYAQLEGSPNGTPKAERTITLRHLYDEDVEAGEYQRSELGPGAVVQGPAVIREPLSTTQVCRGQKATVGSYGELIIESEN